MKEIRQLKTIKERKKFEHKPASPAKDQNEDITLLHSCDDLLLSTPNTYKLINEV